MGFRNASVHSTAVISSPTAGSEVIVCSVGPLNLINDSAVVYFYWWLVVTIGTAGVSVTLRLRRGITNADTLIISQSPVTAVAGNTQTYSGMAFDTIQGGAEINYGLGLVVNSATGTSTVQQASMIAMVI
jgi:hypothetical protein